MSISKIGRAVYRAIPRAVLWATIVGLVAAWGDDVVQCYDKTGTLDEVIAACDRALEADVDPATSEADRLSEQASLLHNRGIARFEKGDYSGAIADYTEALRLEPYADTHYHRGRAYARKGDLELAIRDYDEALRLFPDYPEAIYSRGDVFAQSGEQERADEDRAAALRLVREREYPVEAAIENSSRWFRSGHYELAIIAYDAVLKRYPNWLMARVSRGEAHEKRKDVDRAEQDYREVLSRKATSEEGHAAQQLAAAGLARIDTSPPVISVPTRLIARTEWINLEGSASDDRGEVRLLLDQRELVLDEDGRFTITVAAPAAGSTTRLLRAVDGAGNPSEVEVTIVRELPPKLDMAQQLRRVALVIGNGAYKHKAVLPNPSNDARAVAAALERLGFEVISGIDLDRLAMEEALITFARAAEDAHDAVVFYAGHGLQVNGHNYLLPIDADFEDERDLRRFLTSDQLVADASGAKRVAVVILDACRDNPFAQDLARRTGFRGVSITRGLAPPAVSPANTLVAYATAADHVAADGSGHHSPFTTGLLRFLEEPGLDVRLLFGKVRDAVAEATSGRQVPFIYGSLGGSEIHLAEARTTSQ